MWPKDPQSICSIDAKMAFDGIPRDVLILKALNVSSDPSWNLLFYFYSNMSIRIRWNNIMGKTIPVEGGTKQGGLSSPHVFNSLYEEMVKQLTFCYADDFLICSLKVSGVQKMIDAEVSHIGSHGL